MPFRNRQAVRNTLGIVVGVGVMATVILVIYLVAAIRQTQTDNAPLVHQTARQSEQIKGLAEKIKSCTDPKGTCYQSGQRRTADAIASINVITLYAAVCGPRVTADMPLERRLSIVRDCVARLTQRHQP